MYSLCALGEMHLFAGTSASLHCYVCCHSCLCVTTLSPSIDSNGISLAACPNAETWLSIRQVFAGHLDLCRKLACTFLLLFSIVCYLYVCMPMEDTPISSWSNLPIVSDSCAPLCTTAFSLVLYLFNSLSPLVSRLTLPCIDVCFTHQFDWPLIGPFCLLFSFPPLYI